MRELGQTRRPDRFGKVRAQPILNPMDARMHVVSEGKINACLIMPTMPSQKNYEIAGDLCGQSRTVVHTR